MRKRYGRKKTRGERKLGGNGEKMRKGREIEGKKQEKGKTKVRSKGEKIRKE